MQISFEDDLRHKVTEILTLLKKFTNKVTFEANTIKCNKIMVELKYKENLAIFNDSVITMYIRDAINIFSHGNVVFDICSNVIKYKYASKLSNSTEIRYERETKYETTDLFKSDIEMDSPTIICNCYDLNEIPFINKETNVTIQNNTVVFSSSGIMQSKFTKECVIVEDLTENNSFQMKILSEDFKPLEEIQGKVTIVFFKQCLFIYRYFEMYTVILICTSK